MAKKTSRPLNNFELIEHFLENALDYDFEETENYEIIPKLVSTELNIENFDESLVSLNSKSYRLHGFRKDSQRRKLHEQIVAELLREERLDDDEQIGPGKGGAFPQSGVITSHDAYIVIGLPASGKSGISNTIADHYGAIVLDSDYAKRKIPEFCALPFGATLVHEESDRIVFGENNPSGFKSLFDYCRELGANIVIPKIGSNYESLKNLVILLKKNDYNVHLTLVELDRIKATQRALTRFKDTGRYVPLGLIFDTYGNNPTIAFYKTITYDYGLLDSYGVISNDVEKGMQPLGVLKSNRYNPANLY